MAVPTNNMRSLDRAFDVLGVLQDAKQPLRLSEVARHASLHVATVQRILGVLLDRGYAARIGDTYTAGPAALAVAHAFMVTNRSASSPSPRCNNSPPTPVSPRRCTCGSKTRES